MHLQTISIYMLQRPEAEGFEPPVPSQVQRFSRPPLSTTQPHLQAKLLRISATKRNLFFDKSVTFYSLRHDSSERRIVP